MNRRQFINRVAVVFLASSAPVRSALAAEEIYTGLVPGVALGGYDAVAYFSQRKPVKGLAEHATRYNGATWHFASVQNRDAFVADPHRYAPQYGGYCAWAVASGYTAKGDPQIWRIVDDKLYLNYSRRVQRRWSKDIRGNISRANGNWPDVLN